MNALFGLLVGEAEAADSVRLGVETHAEVERWWVEKNIPEAASVIPELVRQGFVFQFDCPHRTATTWGISPDGDWWLGEHYGLPQAFEGEANWDSYNDRRARWIVANIVAKFERLAPHGREELLITQREIEIETIAVRGLHEAKNGSGRAVALRLGRLGQGTDGNMFCSIYIDIQKRLVVTHSAGPRLLHRGIRTTNIEEVLEFLKNEQWIVAGKLALEDAFKNEIFAKLVNESENMRIRMR
ncbi:hypothetical protein [Methylobacterium sp. CM6257]